MMRVGSRDTRLVEQLLEAYLYLFMFSSDMGSLDLKLSDFCKLVIIYGCVDSLRCWVGDSDRSIL